MSQPRFRLHVIVTVAVVLLDDCSQSFGTGG